MSVIPLFPWGNYWQLRWSVKPVPYWFDSNRGSMEINWSKIYTNMANQVESVASMASGQHKYELANQLWAFEKELREMARLEVNAR